MTDKTAIIEELPPKMKIEMINLMYKKELEGIKFFKTKSTYFKAAVAPLLQQLTYEEG